MWLFALALLGQSLGISGYLLDAQAPDAVLVLPTGRYEVALGPGCEFLEGDANVEVLVGSSGSAVLIQSDQRCPALVGDLVDETPCAQNADGNCDVAAEIDQ